VLIKTVTNSYIHWRTRTQHSSTMQSWSSQPQPVTLAFGRL